MCRYTSIPFQDRLCPLCHSDTETEFHFLMVYPCLLTVRMKCFSAIWYTNPSIDEFIQLYAIHKIDKFIQLTSLYNYMLFTKRKYYFDYIIMQTFPCNVHPLTPHFYIYMFLIFALRHRL